MTAPPDPGDVAAVDPAAIVDPAAVVDSSDGVEPTEDGAVVADRPRPGLRAVGAWLVFAGGAVALDGWVGGAVAVVVAAVVLAGLRRQLLGALGVALLAAVPVAVLVGGVPGEGEVGPAFVTRSLWPHHLTFAGLTLVGVWAILDIVAHRQAARDDGLDLASAVDPVAAPFASWPTLARVGLVAALGIGAVVASVAVVSS